MESRASGRHSGSSFDDFLEEEGYRDEVESVAAERVLGWQFEQQMAQGEGYLLNVGTIVPICAPNSLKLRFAFQSVGNLCRYEAEEERKK